MIAVVNFFMVDFLNLSSRTTPIAIGGGEIPQETGCHFETQLPRKNPDSDAGAHIV